MSERVLLLSGASEWSEAIKIEMMSTEHEFACGRRAVSAKNKVRSFKPTIAAINVDAPTQDAPDASGERIMIAAELARLMRGVDKKLPIVFVSAVADDWLTAVSHLFEPGEVQVHQGIDADKLAAAIIAAGVRMRGPGVILGSAPSSATIEITISATTIEYEAHVGSLTKPIDPAPWTAAREVRWIDAEFRDFEADAPFFGKTWESMIIRTSEKLQKYLFDERVLDLQKFCKANMAPDGTIHYRFIVPSDDMEHVPFELISSGNSQEYMREVSPIARKMVVARQHKDPDRPLKPRRGDGRNILLLNAAVAGNLAVAGHTFKGKNDVNLSPLAHLGKELESLIEVHGVNRVKAVDLTEKGDARAMLVKALEEGPYDVIHFAGHSVRSDHAGEVFLALPGEFEGLLQPYSVDDFARRAADADARLVILSSCENCSCRTLLRMAAFGVPAVAGFRWPVDDADAAVFTPALHHELFKNQKSIIRAFYAALMKLKECSHGRITRFSPILMLQNSTWHDYRLEDSVA